MSVLILEEALGIESLALDQRFELLLESSDESLVGRGWLRLSVERLGTSISNCDIDGPLKVLDSEYLVNTIAEFLPSDMGTCFRRLEVIRQLSELGSR